LQRFGPENGADCGLEAGQKQAGKLSGAICGAGEGINLQHGAQNAVPVQPIPQATCRTARPFTGIQRQDDLTVDLWDCLTIQQIIVLQGFFLKKYYDISLIRV
jgi:hypothetical protein